tara:strand:- start:2731 stop:3039 length:309 start_codon:yes stop_codon:yes gene_type:complete
MVEYGNLLKLKTGEIVKYLSLSLSFTEFNSNDKFDSEIRPFIHRYTKYSDIQYNLTEHMKILKLKEFIKAKVRLIRLKYALWHWACKPNGPLYNLAMKRLHE